VDVIHAQLIKKLPNQCFMYIYFTIYSNLSVLLFLTFTVSITDKSERLVNANTLDHTIDVNTKNHIYSFSQVLGDSLKMVPA